MARFWPKWRYNGRVMAREVYFYQCLWVTKFWAKFGCSQTPRTARAPNSFIVLRCVWKEPAPLINLTHLPKWLGKSAKSLLYKLKKTHNNNLSKLKNSEWTQKFWVSDLSPVGIMFSASAIITCETDEAAISCSSFSLDGTSGGCVYVGYTWDWLRDPQNQTRTLAMKFIIKNYW